MSQKCHNRTSRPRSRQRLGDIDVDGLDVFSKLPLVSMVAYLCPHFAAKYPIGPTRIDENDGSEEQCADQQESLGAWRRCCFPECEMIGHYHWKQANGDANIGKREQPDRSDK